MTSTRPYVIAKRAVWEAYQQVKANRGAAGIDDETIVMFEQNLSRNLYKLWNRIAQTVVKRIIEPMLDPIFHPDSYGYRPGRSAKQAIAVTTYFPFITCTKPSADTHIKKVIALDTQCSGHDVFPNCYFMGVFGKSTSAPPVARPWSDTEMMLRLSAPVPILPSLLRQLMLTPAGLPLRRLKHALTRFAA